MCELCGMLVHVRVNVCVCVTVHAHECVRVLACVHAFRSQNGTLLSSLVTPRLTALRQGLSLHQNLPFHLGCLHHEVVGSTHHLGYRHWQPCLACNTGAKSLDSSPHAYMLRTPAH